MSEVMAFRKFPLPADSNPNGRLRRVLIEPAYGGWWLLLMDEDGCSDEGVHSKADALRQALHYVELFNAELELNNRPTWDRGCA